MKFVSALKQTDYANRLREIEKEKEKLRQRLVALKNEQASIVNFLPLLCNADNLGVIDEPYFN